ncbi:LuxR family transcriptional regulator [Nocardioides guangzhouensis]|uniref:LuxR family transcriptional regulator n=1 Tax=Nocardioides guangzhouensis TaxID=2497878 RepID=A0A4Q4Z8E6_9ACTN|nr:LuxR C-terminal-related transcriptional regulator [Nocardioides guangzhouensis]RYP84150.1 LuxR family transcriptional regulator [Nocardioides guangzhouensis]
MVSQRLAGNRAITLTGPGGVGKTRIAMKVLERERRAYPDGCWFVDLGTVPDGALVAATVAGALRLYADAAAPTPDGIADFVADFVSDREALLVLDGCEHVLEATALLALRLRARCPRLRIMSTSRQRLGISGEAVVLVPPLTVPEGGHQVAAEALSQFEAVELFVDRAMLARSDFALSESNAPAVAELCAGLEGIPLALELAAARAGSFSPESMLEQLTDRYGFLSQGYRDLPDRHRSLRACVQWSHDLCTEQEQLVWARMSVFSGGCDLTAAARVCADEDVLPGELLGVISALVDKSVLVASEGRGGAARYRMLATIAEFGTERLRAAGELHLRRERHLDWCSSLASTFRSDWSGAGQAAALRRVRDEHANIRAALEFCVTESSTPEAGLRLAADLEAYWVTAGLADEARYWLEIGLGSDRGDPALRAQAMALLGRFAGLQHDFGAARAWADEADAAAEAADDHRTREMVQTLTAILAVRDGDLGLAVDASRRAVSMLPADAPLSVRLRALFVRGVCLRLAGDATGAAEVHEQAVLRGAEAGETFWRSFSLTGLGELALDGGRVDRADELFGEALRLKVELGDRLGIALCLDALGRVALAGDDPTRAAVLLGAAESIWDAIGMRETGNPFARESSRSEGIHRARAALGKRAFRTEFRRGSALSEQQAVACALGETREPAPQSAAEPSPLTRRETEVAALVAEGLSNPEIAERLVISVRTAQGHVENILRKLGFTSRARVAAWVTHRQAVTREPGLEPLPAPPAGRG